MSQGKRFLICLSIMIEDKTNIRLGAADPRMDGKAAGF